MHWLFFSVLLAIVPQARGADSAVKPSTTELSVLENGAAVFSDRDRGHCLLCHALSKHSGSFQGNLGPSLDGVAKRFDRPELTARIADSRQFNPQTIMPPYYSTDKLAQVSTEFKGKTVLTKSELEDLVSYLLSDANE